VKPKFKKLTITLDEKTYQKLKEDAEQTMCSMSFIVRDALREYYENKEKQNKRRLK